MSDPHHLVRHLLSLRVCLTVVLMAIVVNPSLESLASAQKTTPVSTLSTPQLTAQTAESAVNLSWTEVTGAKRYELWAWTSAGRLRQIGGVKLTGTSYSHTEVTAGTTYYYTVRAVSTEVAAGPWSEYAPVTFKQPVAAPTLTADAGEGEVELSWGAVEGAARYELWVWTSVDGFQQIGGVNLTGTSFTHADAVAGTTYYYAIRAVSAGGETGAWSQYVSATPAQAQQASQCAATSASTVTSVPTTTWTAPALDAQVTESGNE